MATIGLVNTLLLFGALLVLAGILSSMVATRFGAPLLLVFLGIGMLAGEDGPGGIPFADYGTTYLVGSLALAAILFDGGMRTQLATLRDALAPSVVLATVGVVLTAVLVAGAARLLLDLSFPEGLLLGAIVGSTDAAAVFFLVRSGGLQLRQRVGRTLEMESSTNDPVAVFLTITLVQMVSLHEQSSPWALVSELGYQIGIGTPVGIGGGFLLVGALNRIRLPAGMQPPFALAAGIAIYGVAAVLGGSGFLAAYLAGLVLGNRPVRSFPSIAGFHDAATWLFQIVMFIMLGLLATPSRLLVYALPAVLIAVFLMLVARPLAVWLCLMPFRFDRRETAFVAWVGLRGAVSIFLAAVPTLAGLPRAELYFDVAFVVVLASLLVQGWTIRLAAEQLDQGLVSAARPVSRVEIDLPGQQEVELVGYPVPADARPVERSEIPDWAHLVMVVRREQVLEPNAAGRLEPGDHAYFLTQPRRVRRLDRLFATTEARPTAEFPVHGEAPIAALAEAYGLDTTEEERELDVAGLFAARLGSNLQPGDRLALDRVTLIVRRIEEDRVAEAGIEIEEHVGEAAERGGFRRKLRALLRRH